MSFPRYPKYKASGIEWLGEVPAHWSVVRVKDLSSRISSGKTPLGGSETYVDDGVLFLRSQNIHDAGLRLDDVVFISRAIDESMASSRAQSGDVLLNITGASIGRSCIVPWSFPLANVNQHVCVIRPKSSEFSEFLAWLFKSTPVKSQIGLVQNGAAREGLNFQQIGGMQVSVAPREEQKGIVDFLDRETAKIDALVVEQEQLIILLKEKRQAVISHAVTKGLDPSVPMKDSGVEWLGQVPAHWVISPLKFLARIGNGSTPSRDNPNYWSEDGFPWLNSSVVNQSEVSEGSRFVTAVALAECHLPIVEPPAVLVGLTGQGKTRGMAAPLTFTATINQHVAFIKANQDHVDNEFLLRVLESAYEYLRIESDSAGSTKGAITCGLLGAWQIPVPTIAEQGRILAFLEAELTKVDSLIVEVEQGIDLLQERRSALISATVAGQIDVRGVQ